MGFSSVGGGGSSFAAHSGYGSAMGDENGDDEGNGGSAFHSGGSSIPVVSRVGSRVGMALGSIWRSLQVTYQGPDVPTYPN